MQQLNPTLWRTCKMLAGPTRIRLLRQLLATPDEGVSALGRHVGIREATASQELRRIQSRGLLQSNRRGPLLVYRMAADPQVSRPRRFLKLSRPPCANAPRNRMRASVDWRSAWRIRAASNSCKPS